MRKLSLLKLNICSIAMIMAIMPQQSLAQEAETQENTPDQEAEETSSIIVTGSRIPRPEVNGILPGVQVTEQEIQTRGFTSTLDFINEIPLIGPGASPNGTNGGQNASLGSAFPDILDLGTQRTLTLVNGRRFVSGNAASLFVQGNASGGQVDLNAIPSALVERTDVVTVGGATAYGSDAIAGVINIILRDDFDGIRLSGNNGITEEGDASSFQLSGLIGKNLFDDKFNVALSAEFTHTEGLQADQRDDRLLRAGAIANFLNGGLRNPNFAPAIIDINEANNGAFLRASDDGIPGLLFAQGIVNQGISFNGSVFNTLATPGASNVPFAVAGQTGSRIRLTNGISQANLSFFNSALQIVPGVPFAGFSATVNNGRAGRTTAIANVPLTTFAPSALPAGVTAAQVFTQFGVTPPTGASAGQLNVLAVNVLQANRPTAREFFAANPDIPTNAFLGSFFPSVARVANTDTRLVTIAGVQVPLNQVLPFIAVPLELSADGDFQIISNATLDPTTPSTFNAALGSTGGFTRAIENVVLRTEQDRFITNLNFNYEITPNLTFFSENLYSNTRTISLRNSPSQNFLTTGAENAALILNVNNPFLDANDLAVLNAAGINAATRGGSFVISRQNQDIFGDNPQQSNVDTYRSVAGVNYDGRLFERDFNAEVSVTYGEANQRTQTTQINDLEYQLALDSARAPNGDIVCRAQLFPNEYLGQTPIGTVSNIVRLPGADGIPTDQIFTPVITQDIIDACQPLNPFGFGQFSAEAAAFVRQDNEIRNKSTQLFVSAGVSSSFFNLPAGPLAFAVNGEYRKETLDFRTDELNQLGRGRAAPSAQTQGTIEVYELGGELRIPLTGEDFLPFLGAIELNPGIRISDQSGSSGTFRNIPGDVVTPTFNGETATIWSIAGTWAPIRDITLRGNITRSIRQASLVELFLGGQPAFSAPGDPCGNLAVTQGPLPATRLANCQAAAIAAGVATVDTAAAFINGFIANAGALAGTFNGSLGLSPERGRSFTFGGVFQPRYIPGLTLTADYFSIDLLDQIIPFGLNGLLVSCFDDPDSDTTDIFGINTCDNFQRGADFQVLPGFSSTFVNQGQTNLRAFNFVGSYTTDLGSDLGRLTLRSNAYHLRAFDISAIGDFSDIVSTSGTPGRPNWEVNSSVRLDGKVFFSQLTWNWVSATQTFSDGFRLPGVIGTIDDSSDLDQPAYSLFDITVGANIDDNFRIQFIVNNIADKRFIDDITRGNFIDNLGRRFLLTATANF